MPMDSLPVLPQFDYIRLETLAEASRFLSQHEAEARPFLGGTDIFVRMRDGFLKPKYLVDVKCLEGMRTLAFDPTAGLTIGAAVTMNQLIASPLVITHYPLLADACRSVAGYQLRNRATVIGNICNASPAGDTIGACLVYDGVLHIHGTDGIRQEPLNEFFLGPGRNTLKCGDIVTSVNLPPPPPGSRGGYLKLGRNKLSDLSIVAVTALGWPAASQASGFRFRIALTSVAPTPLLLTNVEDFLATHFITSDNLAEAARLAAASCSPIDDVRGSARYRKLMVKNLTARLLMEVWERLTEQFGGANDVA
jgi:CO/xanthine dehydrogenase FAD-binding subunit